MNAKEMIEIVDTNGNNTMVELITYLISDDRLKQYIVYTKGEIKGEGNDQVIYISKLFKDNELISTKTTNEKGEYSFVGVIPGEYKIKYTYGDHVKTTTENVGDNTFTTYNLDAPDNSYVGEAALLVDGTTLIYFEYINLNKDETDYNSIIKTIKYTK